MARVTRLVIGEKNFTETACGFCFKASVCEPEEEIDDSHIRVRRLLALFPGSTVETVLSKPAQKEPEKKGEGPKAGPCPKCGQVDTGQQGEYPCEECGLPTLHGEEEKTPDAPEAETRAPEADAKPDTAPERTLDAQAAAVVTVEAPGVPNSADPAELAKAVGEDHAAKAEAEVEPAKASDETAELEPVAKFVAGEGQNDPADAGDSAKEADAKKPDGE